MKFVFVFFVSGLVIDSTFSVDLTGNRRRRIKLHKDVSKRQLRNRGEYKTREVGNMNPSRGNARGENEEFLRDNMDENLRDRGGYKLRENDNKNLHKGHSISNQVGKKMYKPESQSEAHNLLKPFTCPGTCAAPLEDEGAFIFGFGIDLVECNECDLDQRWRINTLKDNYVQIENVGTGLCIQPVDGLPGGEDEIGSGCIEFALELGPCSVLTGYPREESLFQMEGNNFASIYCSTLFGRPFYLDSLGSIGGCLPDDPLIVSDTLDVLLHDFSWFLDDCPLHPSTCPGVWY